MRTPVVIEGRFDGMVNGHIDDRGGRIIVSDMVSYRPPLEECLEPTFTYSSENLYTHWAKLGE